MRQPRGFTLPNYSSSFPSSVSSPPCSCPDSPGPARGAPGQLLEQPAPDGPRIHHVRQRIPGEYPTIQRYIGDQCDIKNKRVLMFDGKSIYPEYLAEARVLVCPSGLDAVQEQRGGRWNRPDGPGGARQGGSANPCLFDQLSYFYLGWIVTTRMIEEVGTKDVSPAFRDAFREVLEGDSPEAFGQAWSFTDDFGEQRQVLRLKEGIERFQITDINNPSTANISQSIVAVMYDRIDLDPRGFNHVPGGTNVLFMDGHVEWVKYPGPFPTNRAWATLVDELNV